MKFNYIVFLTINLFYNTFQAYAQQGNEKKYEPDTLQLEVFLPTFNQVFKEIDLMLLLREIDETKNNEPQSPLIKLKKLDSLYQLQRTHSEYLSLKAKYELFLITPEKETRIFLLKSIRVFPFYLCRDPYYNNEFRDLYRRATRDLIREYRGNLEELYRIDIVPSMQPILDGFLKWEIEHAGGVWNH
ncbi:MAG TPA: hypothetical protein VK168_15375 [Saprospiraceae bacterium]|nr:hypothetical protein [Saprospiraceae bacterium]